eukprot:3533706-Amphidinium_carterae.1
MALWEKFLFNGKKHPSLHQRSESDHCSNTLRSNRLSKRTRITRAANYNKSAIASMPSNVFWHWKAQEGKRKSRLFVCSFDGTNPTGASAEKPAAASDVDVSSS